MPINRNSPLPLYFQLKEVLLSSIQHGEWKPGEQLPTEEEIQEKYGLSRTTVRQALRDLELEGRINRQPGRGTFVSQPKIQEGSESFNQSVKAFKEQGLELVWQVLSAEQIPAPEAVADQLKIAPFSSAFCLRRLRLANQTPIGFVVSYVSGDFIKNVDLAWANQGGSMNYIRGMDLSRCIAERLVEALPAEREDARMLDIDRGVPVLVITRLLRCPDARPIEYFRGVYRGDRFRYHVQSLPPQV